MYSQTKLCLFKFALSDSVCIRPFCYPVTNYVNILITNYKGHIRTNAYKYFLNQAYVSGFLKMLLLLLKIVLVCVCARTLNFV